MADAIRPTQVPETFRETAATARTAPRGDSSRTPAPQTPSGAAAAVRADEGPATVVASRDLGEGRAQISLSDGRTITRAANDMLRETAPDGHMRLSLPNGMLIERDAEGKTAGFDPATGKKLHVKVEQQSENGQYYFELKDSKGNHWLATSETLRFEVTNHAGTVHQKVASTNSMQLSTTTVLRGEDGAFHQETNTATVRPDGQVLGHGARNKSMHVTNEMVTVRQSNGNRVEIDLPYAIPFDLKSEATAAPAPKAAPPAAPSTLVQTEPGAEILNGAPPADTPMAVPAPGPVPIAPNAYSPVAPAAPFTPAPSPFSGQAPGYPNQMPMPGAQPFGGAPMGAPQMPQGMPFAGAPTGFPPQMPGAPFVAPGPYGGPYMGGMPCPAPFPPGGPIPPTSFPGGMPFPNGASAPWQMPPFEVPGGGPVPLPADPYATVGTAAGVVRGAQPDGSMFASFPNGIVLSEGPNGRFHAYDARTTEPLRAAAVDVITPNGGPEKQITFRDAAGNEYMCYSKSLDFAVTSADGRTRQIMMPQGNVLVMSQVPTTDPQGQPTTQQAMVEVLPDGRVNTFGATNLQLGLNALTVGTPAGPVQMPLPYPISQFQGILSTVQSVAQYPTAVSGTMYTPSTQPTPPAPPAPPQSAPSPAQGYQPAWLTPEMPPVPPTPPTSGTSPAPPAGATTAPAAQPAANPFWGANGPVWGDSPSPTPAAPPSATSGTAAVPPQLEDAVNQIMTQALGEHPAPEAAAELRPLLVKMLTNTATPEEAQRASAIVEAAGAAQAPPAASPPPSGTPEAPPAGQHGAPPADAAAGGGARIPAGGAQLVGPSGDAAVGKELEALYFKAVTGTADQNDIMRIQALEQKALDGNPTLKAQLEAQAAAAQPPAPQAETPAPAPQAETPAPAPQAETPAPAPQAETPAPTAPPTLDEKQTAAVQQAMAQMQGAGADEATLAELQPLLERIVSHQASPEQTQRADALIQDVLAKMPQPATPQGPAPQPASSAASAPAEDGTVTVAPYGVPHIANPQELYAAANGRPEFAYASNTPEGYQQWAQQALQAAVQARAQQQPLMGEAPSPAASAPAPSAAPSPQGAGIPSGAPPPAPPAAAPGAAARDTAVPTPGAFPGGAPAAASTVAAPLAPGFGVAPQAAAAASSAPVGGPASVNPTGAASTSATGGAQSAFQGPHKPGVWQRMKSFFHGSPSGAPRYSSWNPYGSWNPYPCQTYQPNPYAPYAAMQAMIAAQMMTTTLSTMMFMPSMYYWNPMMTMGGFPGVLW